VWIAGSFFQSVILRKRNHGGHGPTIIVSMKIQRPQTTHHEIIITMVSLMLAVRFAFPHFSKLNLPNCGKTSPDTKPFVVIGVFYVLIKL
jgi:hypothetical protein